ncbi:MAG: hypothetical protein VKL39_23970 [Leptolyngbyaceae bacterium]|nr:hypothetical protein [Leptolyngbyaceae bacterium]
MTAQELNQAIIEGTKTYGSRNAFLGSPEYAKMYVSYSRQPKEKKQPKKVSIVEVNGKYQISSGKMKVQGIEVDTFECHSGAQFGILSGPMQFSNRRGAELFCNSKKWIY